MTREHPRVLVRRACTSFGERDVALWCADLMSGREPAADAPSVEWLGGQSTDPHPYWHRTWGARGLLYAWDPAVAPDVLAALADEHWRVREMGAKVVRTRRIAEAADALVDALTDPVDRVRTAALRALGEVGGDPHLQAVADARDDSSPAVRRDADAALRRITARA